MSYCCDVIRRWILYSLCLSLLVFPPAATYASWWWPFGNDRLDYTIEIEGVDKKTAEWFETLKLDEKTGSHPPQNHAELAQEAMGLETHINQALKAKGHYEAQIEQKIDIEATPPVLRYTISPGKQTLVSTIRLEWLDAELPAPDLQNLLQQPGEAVDAQAIETDAQTLYAAISKDACLLSLNITPKLLLNPTKHEADLVYSISHGQKARFGDVTIQGNTRTKEKTINRVLAWKKGECFSEEKIVKSQSALFGTQLFTVVKITPGIEVNAQGQVPIIIELNERSPRTLSAGANYATDSGFGVKFGWEHRNFSGGAEKVTSSMVIAQQEQSLALTERIPAFRRNNQVLALAAGVKNEDTDAYTSQALNLSAGLERKISKKLNVGAGVAYDLKQTDDTRTGSETYSLISTPLFAEYDTRDNAQDAKKGIFARANVTPYQDMLAPDLQFVKSTVTGQTYYSPEVIYKPTLALRASLGSIAGSPYRDLPADLRYYAGGGGSVRGYSYQSLSPRFNGEPVGGGSLVEMAAELRVRFTDTIGAVAFFDAGNAYSSSLPRFNEKLYYGAGVGARYYSAIGPIRLDVGVPLNGKDINQHGYAIYVSLGQAF